MRAYIVFAIQSLSDPTDVWIASSRSARSARRADSRHVRPVTRQTELRQVAERRVLATRRRAEVARLDSCRLKFVAQELLLVADVRAIIICRALGTKLVAEPHLLQREILHPIGRGAIVQSARAFIERFELRVCRLVVRIERIGLQSVDVRQIPLILEWVSADIAALQKCLESRLSGADRSLPGVERLLLLLRILRLRLLCF